MPSQREIRRRIGAVRNIRQITRAMQFVAASKLKRAQDATLASIPTIGYASHVQTDVISAARQAGVGERHGGLETTIELAGHCVAP